jgi:dihydroxyacetone kinase
MQLGGASPGDRSMLDALVPASEAFANTQGDIGARIAAMLEAALAGVEATKSMQPKRGRSTYMGDRTAGHPDPGAVAVTVWMGALKRT